MIEFVSAERPLQEQGLFSKKYSKSAACNHLHLHVPYAIFVSILVDGLLLHKCCNLKCGDVGCSGFCGFLLRSSCQEAFASF